MSELELTDLEVFLDGLVMKTDTAGLSNQQQRRAALLPALQKAQALYGWIPPAAAQRISQALHVPLADIQGVIDFYSLLSDRPGGQTTLRVCTDPVCALHGAEELLAAAGSKTSSTGKINVERTTCLGLCEHAPAVLVSQKGSGEHSRAGLDEDGLNALLASPTAPERNRPVRVYGSLDALTARCRSGQRAGLEEYRRSGGWQALEKALGLTPQAVIAEIKTAGLVGRGGAAFPTAVKWAAAAAAPGAARFVVCNADESEPGTFKDRVLLESDPHAVLEGLAIASYAIGARRGYIYVRGEYPEAYAALEQALQETRQAGLLTPGGAWDFEIELRRGAGAYICGEETALFESIEGKRGYPRLKPPFPTTHGLFGMPTVINNVETLCNVPVILRQGAEAYRAIGTAASPGPKLFCVSGDVVRPGVYEAPFGVSLRSLLYEQAGGIPGGRALQTVLVGGAAGVFAGPEQLDVPLAFETLKAAGLPLGSGVLMVFDERRDLRDVLLRLARFFAHESCGKCYPCQMGTQRQAEILERAAAGRSLPGDRQRLLDLGQVMTSASICGLGQTAASAVLSAIQRWPNLAPSEPGEMP